MRKRWSTGRRKGDKEIDWVSAVIGRVPEKLAFGRQKKDRPDVKKLVDGV